MLYQDVELQMDEELNHLNEYIDSWKNDYTSDYMLDYIKFYRRLTPDELTIADKIYSEL